jgi:hypothetical protein
MQTTATKGKGIDFAFVLRRSHASIRELSRLYF